MPFAQLLLSRALGPTLEGIIVTAISGGGVQHHHTGTLQARGCAGSRGQQYAFCLLSQEPALLCHCIRPCSASHEQHKGCETELQNPACQLVQFQQYL